MKTFRFIIVLFLVSFLSDIVLNDLAHMKSGQGEIIKSLRPYFANKSITMSGVYAGLTILSAFIPTSFIFNLVVGERKWVPSTLKELVIMLAIAFPIGYLYDYLIYKLHIFGDALNDYYRIAGAGMWGALSFVFAIIITYITINAVGC